MRRANQSIPGLFILHFLLISSLTVKASSIMDTVITRSITISQIKHMKVVGNVDLILIKSETEKVEIMGVANIVTGLTFQNDSESILISESAADRHTSHRIKITLWLRNPIVQSMSCTG